MTIGELLKQKRLEKEKTQKTWVGNIVSPSYYAKVEKNIHRITADDLLALLKYNNISIPDFFQELIADEDIFEDQTKYWSNAGITATYNNDLKKLKEIEQEVQNSNLPKNLKEIGLLIVQGEIESVKMDLDPKYKPSQDFTAKLKDKIFSIPEITELKLQLFGNFLYFYDYKTSSLLLKQFFKKVDFKTANTKELIALGAIINNYVSQSIEENCYEGLDYYFDYIEQFPKSPELYLVRTSITVLKHVVRYHFKQDQKDLDICENIIQTYMHTGLESFGKSAQEFVNQEVAKMRK